jgi:hypothetical protein
VTGVSQPETARIGDYGVVVEMTILGRQGANLQHRTHGIGKVVLVVRGIRQILHASAQYDE